MTKQTDPEVTVQRVADEVRAEMARQRRTAAELAAVLDITPQTAGKRLNARIPFNMLELAIVANWLGSDTKSLIARATQPDTEAVAS